MKSFLYLWHRWIFVGRGKPNGYSVQSPWSLAFQYSCLLFISLDKIVQTFMQSSEPEFPQTKNILGPRPESCFKKFLFVFYLFITFHQKIFSKNNQIAQICFIFCIFLSLCIVWQLWVFFKKSFFFSNVLLCYYHFFLKLSYVSYLNTAQEQIQVKLWFWRKSLLNVAASLQFWLLCSSMINQYY